MKIIFKELKIRFILLKIVFKAVAPFREPKVKKSAKKTFKFLNFFEIFFTIFFVVVVFGLTKFWSRISLFFRLFPIFLSHQTQKETLRLWRLSCITLLLDIVSLLEC